MTVRLKYSKTDPFGRGKVIMLYSTGSFTCPVKTMQRYLSSRSWLMDQPLFITREGKPLTRNYFICLLREALSKLCLSASFIRVIVFVSVQQPLLLLLVCRIGLFEPLAVGLQTAISCIFVCLAPPYILHYCD